MIGDSTWYDRWRRERNPDIRPIWMAKTFRHHSDDSVRSAVERDRRAQNIGARIERLAPEIVADNRYGRSVWTILVLHEGAAQCRRQTKDPKKVRADPGRRDGLRGRAIGQSDGHVYAGRHTNALKNVATKFTPTCHRLIAQVDRSAARTAFLLRLIDPHQPLSMRKRERPQERAFDDGKNGGVRPDSERERSDGDETESG